MSTGAASTGRIAPPGVPAIEFDRVSAKYETVQALHDISLQVPAGSVFAVLGPNGAGKTTLLAVAAGLLPTTAGQLRVTGNDVAGLDATARACHGICLIPRGAACSRA